MNTNSQDNAAVRGISTRQLLIETAVRVFSTNGFHRSSLDLIALEAGVSKMTIFYHFKNKEELVIAALDDTHQRCMANVRQKAISRSHDAKSYLSVVFGILEEESAAGKLSNLYLRASAEFTEEDSPVREIIATHVRSVEARFGALAVEAGFQNPAEVVTQLMHILRGIYAAQICPAGALRTQTARRMADCVIRVSPSFVA